MELIKVYLAKSTKESAVYDDKCFYPKFVKELFADSCFGFYLF